MGGTSSSEEKLAGDPGNVIEATSIGGRRSDLVTAGKISAGQFRTFATISAPSGCPLHVRSSGAKQTRCARSAKTAAEARRLGTERTAIVHAVGIAFAATAFVLLLVTNGSDKVGIGLYLVLLAWSLGAAAATGSFGGVVATMALALVAMVHGIWGAAIASGVRDAGQAYIAIFYVPPLLVPVLATAAFGRWLGSSLRARRSHDRPG